MNKTLNASKIEYLETLPIKYLKPNIVLWGNNCITHNLDSCEGIYLLDYIKKVKYKPGKKFL